MSAFGRLGSVSLPQSSHTSHTSQTSHLLCFYYFPSRSGKQRRLFEDIFMLLVLSPGLEHLQDAVEHGEPLPSQRETAEKTRVIRISNRVR